MISVKKLLKKCNIIFLGVSLLALSNTILPSIAEAKISIGLVDMQKVLLTVDESKGVRKQLEDDLKKKQDSLKKDENKFKDLQEKFEKQRLVMNESAKVEKEKELRDLYVTLQEKTMKFQQDLQDLERNLKRPIIDKIRGVVEGVSKTASVDVTFETGTTPLVYAENKKDITEDVISAYNKQFPSK